MRHYALFRLYKVCDALGVFPLAHAVVAMLFRTEHKISSLFRGCCFMPLVDLNGAKIMVYF